MLTLLNMGLMEKNSMVQVHYNECLKPLSPLSPIALNQGWNVRALGSSFLFDSSQHLSVTWLRRMDGYSFQEGE